MKPTLQMVSRKTEIIFLCVGTLIQARVNATLPLDCQGMWANTSPSFWTSLVGFDAVTDKTILSDWASCARSALPEPSSALLTGLADLQIASQGLPYPLSSHGVWLVGGTCWRSESKREKVWGYSSHFLPASLFKCWQWLLPSTATATVAPA